MKYITTCDSQAQAKVLYYFWSMFNKALKVVKIWNRLIKKKVKYRTQIQNLKLDQIYINKSSL